MHIANRVNRAESLTCVNVRKLQYSAAMDELRMLTRLNAETQLHHADADC